MQIPVEKNSELRLLDKDWLLSEELEVRSRKNVWQYELRQALVPTTPQVEPSAPALSNEPVVFSVPNFQSSPQIKSEPNITPVVRPTTPPIRFLLLQNQSLP